MLFDNPALMQLKQSFDSTKVKKKGSVKATERGFGFLECDKESFFITPNDMRNLMHGDKISAVINTDAQGRNQAKPEALISPFLERFVARVILIKGKPHVEPDHPNIKQRILADDKRAASTQSLKNGDFVICTLTAHAFKDKIFKAEITEYICAADDPQAPWIVTLRKYDLPLQEPADEQFTLLDSDLPREDLTALPFITIDSAHTEDMDDALYLEKNEQGFTLYTAIADPSAYIAVDSPLDKIAAQNDFSIYLPGRDIPMLPRVLSQNLCSLRENELRPALVGVFSVDLQGQIDFSKTKFILARVKSQGKLIYDKVSDFLEGQDTDFVPDHTIASLLHLLDEFANIRATYRQTHAAAFINRPDYEFVLNEQGALDHIEIEYRRSANIIVEEAMVCSNICCGEFLANHLHGGIFNGHSGFDLTHKKELMELLDQEHIPYTEDSLNTLETYNAIRRQAVSEHNLYLDARIRQLQEFSQIGIESMPHYALGVQSYATFTSPIRKYGDLVNHRLIKAFINGQQQPNLPDKQTLKAMNQARKLNRQCEREVRDWLYVDYLEPHIQQRTVFKATIFDISRGGMRVCLEDNGAMLFVPVSLITSSRDSLEIDADHGIIYANSKKVLQLADTLTVRVFAVDKKNRSITGIISSALEGLLAPDESDYR